MNREIINKAFYVFFAGWLSLSVQAEDFVVANLDDSGPGSLRQAVLDARDNSETDNITFDGALSGQIDLGDQIWIPEGLTITGFLEDPSRITIDGGGEDRIFEVTCDSDSGESVTIGGLTLTHGRLGPLADNGGPTETHAITDTSLAFNVVPEEDCVSFDQRGVARPQLGDCDLGAFELAIPEQTLTELFASLVEAGDLTGDGKGKSAANRLSAMSNKIAAIDAFLEQGDIDQACEELASALRKTDGERRPPDFVKGPGAATLAAAIEETQYDACL